MGEWPEGWFRDGRAPDDPSAADGGRARSADETVGIPAPQHPGGQYRAGQYGAGPGASGQAAGRQGASPPAGAWPSQPPVSSAAGTYGSGGSYGSGYAQGASGSGRGGGSVATPTPFPSRTGGPGLPGTSRGRRWLRPRRIFGVLALVVALVLAVTAGTYFYLNSKLDRSNILVDYPGRPA